MANDRCPTCGQRAHFAEEDTAYAETWEEHMGRMWVGDEYEAAKSQVCELIRNYIDGRWNGNRIRSLSEILQAIAALKPICEAERHAREADASRDELDKYVKYRFAIKEGE